VTDIVARNYSPTINELENLFINNEAMETIDLHLNRFNPIKVMRMERMEIRHSAILAWLLDPKESHGLNDRFLKAFLAEALRGQSALGYPTALDITHADMRDAVVRREWQSIDIFIHSVKNNWGFIVENKFDSKQSEGQLASYMKSVEGGLGKQYDGLIVRGIFLTLYDEEPQDSRYSPVNYEAICDFLPRFMEQETHLITAEVRTFLLHYLEILKDEVGMSDERDELEKLARQLYRDHKKTLDFIIEHGANSDFSIAAQSIFGDAPDYLDLVNIENKNYVFFWLGSDKIAFIPGSWYSAMGEETFDFAGCENFGGGYPVTLWFQLNTNADGATGQLVLYSEVGPILDYELRRQLIQKIQKAASDLETKRISFQSGATDEGRKFSKFFKQNLSPIKDVQDADEIATSMKKLLGRFEKEFQIVAKVLPLIKEYGTPAE